MSVILGIESSCDETAASVYDSNKKVLSNIIFSQLELHKLYGGVVPEIASRAHLEKITPIVDTALKEANVTISEVDAIAVTYKPGLPGSLLVGLCFAKSLAWSTSKKFIGVDHLEGHVFSACIENDIPFPFLCLTASGGHTALYIVTGFGEYQRIGYTIDDAAGEAFDKIAKLIGLPYPGGPVIEKLAKLGNFEDCFNYPRSLPKSLNFSFSGLKTAIMYNLVEQGAYNLATKEFLQKDNEELKIKVSSSMLVCISDIFKEKLNIALKQYPNVKAISFVGGVACNKYLQAQLTDFAKKNNLNLFYPSAQYCTDNGAMIAFVGNYKYNQKQFSNFDIDINS